MGESLQFYILSAAIALVTGGIFYAFNALKALKDAQITTEKAKSSLSETKFIHLKNQIDPHFLFNSLNVLSGLIEEDAEKAFRYTNSLSAIYRSMLSQKDKDLVPLREELATGEEFLYLLQIRFEGALTYEIEAGLEREQKFVVPLCLQLLLENAVKHNEASDARPLQIKIYSDSDYLVVENNLQPRNSFVESNKLGLSIITERYRSLTERSVHIEQNDGIFRVALPLMPKI
nr:histidine kinase [Sphingobacterium sp. lm-10]